MIAESESQMDLYDFEHSEGFEEESLEIVGTALSSNELITTELFIPFVIITSILGGLTVYYLYKFFKKSN